MKKIRISKERLQPARIAWVLSILLFIAACSTNQNKNKTGATGSDDPVATKPAPRLDPNSSPLYPAHSLTPAPDFSVTLLNGNPFRLSDQNGKIVLINIWATWCPPCRQEIPELVSLYNRFKDKGLIILGVSIDEQGESVVRPFVKKFNITYPCTSTKTKPS